MINVLIVEYEYRLANIFESANHVAPDGFYIERARDVSEALQKLRKEIFSVVIIAWSVRDVRAVDICRRYRGMQGTSPVLIIGDTEFIIDISEAFQAGADDFLPRSFDPCELFARVRALSRRSRVYESDLLQVGSLVLDPVERRVYKDGKEINLLAKEFTLLELLMRYPRHNFSAEAILERLWSATPCSSTDTVRTHIKTLRQKLGSDRNDFIVTRRGLGYCLEPQPERELATA